MKIAPVFLIIVLLSSSVWADEASHRKSAERLLEMSKSEQAMKTGFQTAIEPMIGAMKQRGMPDAAAGEMRTAFNEWFATEIKWDDLRPQIADLYVKEFTEPELKELIAFYETPTGQKALTKLPLLVQQSSQIGQQYAGTKQGPLNKTIEAIVAKYRSQAGGSALAPAAPAAPATPAPKKK